MALEFRPSIKGSQVVKLMSARDRAPLYEVMSKSRGTVGAVEEFVIATEEEPAYRGSAAAP
jgi:hypothetical protein